MAMKMLLVGKHAINEFIEMVSVYKNTASNMKNKLQDIGKPEIVLAVSKLSRYKV